MSKRSIAFEKIRSFLGRRTAVKHARIAMARREAASRHPHAESWTATGFEPLEPRVLLTATWDGGGADDLWSNPLNWSPNSLPDPNEDVIIPAEKGDGTPIPSDKVIFDLTGTTTIGRIVSDLPFEMAETSGTLAVTDINEFGLSGQFKFGALFTNSLTLLGGTIDTTVVQGHAEIDFGLHLKTDILDPLETGHFSFQGGDVVGDIVVEGSGLHPASVDLGPLFTDTIDLTFRGVDNSLTGDIKAGQTITIEGTEPDAFSFGVLKLAPDSGGTTINLDGTIRLNAVDTGAAGDPNGAVLNLGINTLQINAGGLIEALNGDTPVADLVGSREILIGPDGRLLNPMGVDIDDITLDATVTEESVDLLSIGGTPVSGVWVGEDGGGDGVSWDDPANWSTGEVPGPEDNVVINVLADDDPMTEDDPTIVIDSAAGSILSLRAFESVTIAAGGSLTVTEPNAFGFGAIFSQSLTMDGGTLDATGVGILMSSDADTIAPPPGAEVDPHPGLVDLDVVLDLNSGSVLGGVTMIGTQGVPDDPMTMDDDEDARGKVNAIADIAATFTDTNLELTFRGSNNTLTGAVASGQTINVEGTGDGDNAFGTGALALGGSVDNAGTINLISHLDLDATGDPTAAVLDLGDNTLTINPTGSVNAVAGEPAARTIVSANGTLVNEGALNADVDTIFIVAGEFIPPPPESPTDPPVVNPITYQIVGGAINGSVYFANTDIRQDADPSAPSEVNLVGVNNRLRTDNFPNSTLNVLGTEIDFDADEDFLTIGDGEVSPDAFFTGLLKIDPEIGSTISNFGSIVLSSLDIDPSTTPNGIAASAIDVVGDVTLINAMTGTIHAAVGAGGDRAINLPAGDEGMLNGGALENRGTDTEQGVISAEAGVVLLISGDNPDTPPDPIPPDITPVPDTLSVVVNDTVQNLAVSPYSTQDKPESTAAIEGGDNETLRVTGNGWKKVAFDAPVTITESTVLSFDFSSTVLAELQGIGFDNDEDVSNAGTIFFEVSGTDSAFPNLNTDFHDYPRGGSVGDVVHYEIPVGQFITGDYAFMTFFNDDDVAPSDGVGVFSNVTLFEQVDDSQFETFTYNAAGGTTTGDVYLLNTVVETTAAPTALPSEFNLIGFNNTLVSTNIPVGVTINLIGTDVDFDADEPGEPETPPAMPETVGDGVVNPDAFFSAVLNIVPESGTLVTLDGKIVLSSKDIDPATTPDLIGRATVLVGNNTLQLSSTGMIEALIGDSFDDPGTMDENELTGSRQILRTAAGAIQDDAMMLITSPEDSPNVTEETPGLLFIGIAAEGAVWTGEGDGTSWDDANNWRLGVVPGPEDDVTIPLEFDADPIIVIDSAQIVRSLRAFETVKLDLGGSLTLTGVIDEATLPVRGLFTHTLWMNGGTLDSTFVDGGGMGPAAGIQISRDPDGIDPPEGFTSMDDPLPGVQDLAVSLILTSGELLGPATVIGTLAIPDDPETAGVNEGKGAVAATVDIGGFTDPDLDLIFQGSNNTLTGNTTEFQTITIQGTGDLATGFGVLNWMGGTNGGNLLLQSLAIDPDDGDAETPTPTGALLQIGDSTLVNAPTGSIGTLAGDGGALGINGTGGRIVNQGLLTADASTLLIIDGDDPETLPPDDTDERITYEADGGAIASPVFFNNTDVEVSTDHGTPSTIKLIGTNNRLLTDNLPNTTLRILGADSAVVAEPRFNNYPQNAAVGDPVHYAIPVGAFAGFAELVFINDDDDGAGSQSIFSNVQFIDHTFDMDGMPIEIVLGTVNFDALAIDAYTDEDGSGSAVASDAGATLTLSGNAWKKVAFPVPAGTDGDVTLEFDFQSSTEGEFHGIGLDDRPDDAVRLAEIFQLFGTQGDVDAILPLDAFGGGFLTLAPEVINPADTDIANQGTIELAVEEVDPATPFDEVTSSHLVLAGHTLINEASGVVDSPFDGIGGGRIVSGPGTIVNRGSITAASAVFLQINGDDPETPDPADEMALPIVETFTFTPDGGTVGDRVFMTHSVLDLSQLDGTEPASAVQLVGFDNTFNGGVIPANFTIHLVGTDTNESTEDEDAFANAVLNVTADDAPTTTLDGTIILDAFDIASIEAAEELGAAAIQVFADSLQVGDTGLIDARVGGTLDDPDTMDVDERLATRRVLLSVPDSLLDSMGTPITGPAPMTELIEDFPGIVDISFVEAINWDGEAGNNLWSDPLNWVGDVVPGPDDHVQINEQPGDMPVIFDATVLDENDEILSLKAFHPLEITGGTLTILGRNEFGVGLLASDTITINGGTLDVSTDDGGGAVGARLQRDGDTDTVDPPGVVNAEVTLELASGGGVLSGPVTIIGTPAIPDSDPMDGILDSRGAVKGVLTIDPLFTTAFDVVFQGTNNELSGTIGAGQTVTIQGTGTDDAAFGPGVLTLGADLVNNGTLVFDSILIDSDMSPDEPTGAVLQVDNPHTFTNNGTLFASLGAGGDSVVTGDGQVNHTGIIDVPSDDAPLLFQGLAFHLDGGDTTGAGRAAFTDADLTFGAGPTTAATLTTIGPSNTLGSDVPEGATIEVLSTERFDPFVRTDYGIPNGDPPPADETYTTPGADQTFTIPLGEFFVGDFQFLTFIQDADTFDAPMGRVGRYIDVTFHNVGPTGEDTVVIDFDDFTVEPYTADQDVDSAFFIEEEGSLLRITGNGWKKIDLADSPSLTGPITIGQDSTLEFTFRSAGIADLHGIGLDNDDDPLNGGTQIFQFAGDNPITSPPPGNFGFTPPEGTFGNAVLTLLTDVSLAGTIHMDSVADPGTEPEDVGASVVNLHDGLTGHTLTIAPTGVVDVDAGAGGGREFIGGNGGVVNEGLIDVELDGHLILNGDLTDPAVAPPDTIERIGYDSAGGVLDGPGFLVNADVSISVAPAAPTDLKLIGFGNALHTDNPHNMNLRVVGTGLENFPDDNFPGQTPADDVSPDAFGHAVLTLIPDGPALETLDTITNHGAITLEAFDLDDTTDEDQGLASATLDIGSANLTNASDGLIDAKAGGGNTREIRAQHSGPDTGVFRNQGDDTEQGQVTADPDTFLLMTGTDVSDIEEPPNFLPIRYEAAGGQLGDRVFLTHSLVDMDDAEHTPGIPDTEIQVIGFDNTLVSDVTPDVLTVPASVSLRVLGTEKNTVARPVVPDPYNPAAGTDEVTIALGAFFTGDLQSLVFVNQNTDVIGDAAYDNVLLVTQQFDELGDLESEAGYEIDFATGTVKTFTNPSTPGSGVTVATFTVESYTENDGPGTANVVGGELILSGNAWKKIVFTLEPGADPITVTPEHVLTFDYTGDADVEFQAVGTDDDDDPQNALLFYLAGTDTDVDNAQIPLDAHGNGVLNLSAPTTNLGGIFLDSADLDPATMPPPLAGNSTVNFVNAAVLDFTDDAPGQTLTNGGVFSVLAGAGGPRVLDAEIHNTGELTIAADTEIGQLVVVEDVLETTGTTIFVGDSGYSSFGDWVLNAGPPAFEVNDVPTGFDSATWQFDGLDEEATYTVYAAWPAPGGGDPARATDAFFLIEDVANPSNNIELTVDQSGASAADFDNSDSFAWQEFGAITLSTGSTALSVTLSDFTALGLDPAGAVVAQGILVVKDSAGTTPTTLQLPDFEHTNTGDFILADDANLVIRGALFTNDVGGFLGGSGSIQGALDQMLPLDPPVPGMTDPGPGIINNGAVAPGGSTGILNIRSNFEQTTGQIQIEIDGTTPGEGHDQLNLAGDKLVLEGSVVVTNIGVSAPMPGEEFDVLTFLPLPGGVAPDLTLVGLEEAGVTGVYRSIDHIGIDTLRLLGAGGDLNVTVNGGVQNLSVSPYSSQDKPTSTASIEDGGDTLRVTGNGWKKVVFDAPVTITEDTVLSFDFSSTVLAELQGIGFDSDEDVVNAGTIFFQVSGTDDAFPNLNGGFHDYPRGGSLGDVVHYEIPVGQFVTGEFAFMTFFNDDDVAPEDGVGVFSNVTLFEAVPVLNVTVNGAVQDLEVTGYSTQDKPESTVAIEEEGAALRVTGNGWKKVVFDAPVTITEDTILSFDFSSTNLAELQGIGFDSDEDVVNAGTIFFQVSGTDSSFPNLNGDFHDYPQGGSLGDVVHYEIPVGQFVTGEFAFMTFFNDDDVAPQDGVGVFSNIELFEPVPILNVTVNGAVQDLEVTGYSTQDKPESTVAIEEDGAALRVTGNGWKKVVFDAPVTITEDTVLSFDFSSTILAELQGIGFDSDEDVVNAGTIFFQVSGTDSSFPNLNGDFHDYPQGGSLGDVVHYEIPVGQFVTGEFAFMTFFNDDDVAPQDGVGVFSNVTLFEDVPPVADILNVTVNGAVQDLEVTGYSTQDKPESTVAIEGTGNETLRVTGNGWKKVVFDAPVTITEDTVLSFDFSSTILAELQGIGFDSDEDVVNEGTIFFQVSGTDSSFPNLNGDFHDYPQGGSLGDVVHYEIPVGQFVTGEFAFMTFFNDDDVAPQDGVGVFSNVTLFEDVPPVADILSVTVNGAVQDLEVTGYSTQDKPESTVAIEGTGNETLRVTGNGWKKVVFDAPVTITEDTVLSFDFSSTILAELQGIGFDSDEDVVNAGTIFFQVSGTDSSFPNLNGDFHDYPQGGSLGDVVHYEIPVGQFVTGEFAFMTFFNDDDVAPQDGVGVFSNVTLFEDVPPVADILNVTVNGAVQDLEVTGYSTQDKPESTVAIEGTGNETLRVTGNGWKKVVFDAPVTITEDTVLSFDFSSTILAELQGIGFDSDEDVVNEGTIFFQVSGTDSSFPNLNGDFHDYPQGGSLGDVVHYEIPVGQFVTGEFAFMTFFNDDDVAPQDGVGVFSNVTLFEDTPPEPTGLSVTVNGETSFLDVVGYSTQDNGGGTAVVEAAGDKLRMTGNTWKKVVFDSPITITENTVLSFDFSSSAQAELHGIGVDSDEDVTNAGTQFFKLFGTDAAFPNLNTTDFNDYPRDGAVGDVVPYTIPIGQFITGTVDFLIFFTDKDAGDKSVGESVFSDLEFFEGLRVTVNGEAQYAPIESYSTQDKTTSTATVGTDSAAVQITGNGWKKFDFDVPITVTSNTVLAFDYSSTAIGELQGIGLDSDDDVTNAGTIFFEVSGTDSAFPNLNTVFHDYPQGGSVGDTVHYEINIGAFVTGTFEFLTFFNDDDVAPQDSNSLFSNIEIFEMT